MSTLAAVAIACAVAFAGEAWTVRAMDKARRAARGRVRKGYRGVLPSLPIAVRS